MLELVWVMVRARLITAPLGYCFGVRFLNSLCSLRTSCPGSPVFLQWVVSHGSALRKPTHAAQAACFPECTKQTSFYSL